MKCNAAMAARERLEYARCAILKPKSGVYATARVVDCPLVGGGPLGYRPGSTRLSRISSHRVRAIPTAFRLEPEDGMDPGAAAVSRCHRLSTILPDDALWPVSRLLV